MWRVVLHCAALHSCSTVPFPTLPLPALHSAPQHSGTSMRPRTKAAQRVGTSAKEGEALKDVGLQRGIELVLAAGLVVEHGRAALKDNLGGTCRGRGWRSAGCVGAVYCMCRA
jgi:hypothetical protein